MRLMIRNKFAVVSMILNNSALFQVTIYSLLDKYLCGCLLCGDRFLPEIIGLDIRTEQVVGYIIHSPDTGTDFIASIDR